MESKPVSGPLAEKLRAQLTSGFYKDFVEMMPGRLVMPDYYPAWHQRFQKFPINKDDVWVATYPKSGTTWMQEIVWCILHGLHHPHGSQGLMTRFPFFEWDALMPEEMEPEPDQAPDDPCLPGNTWKLMAAMARPRTIKIHLQKPMCPAQMWQVRPKMVYVCRDPRDVCISYYFHSIKLDGYTGDLSDFVDLFLADMLPWSPFWSHVLDFWKMRNEDHVMFVKFEDMKVDLAGTVRQVADFLEHKLTEEQLEKVAQHCTFSSMSKNKAVNNEDLISPGTERAAGIKFMRKGQVGDWKNHLTEEQQRRFQEWTTKNLQGSDFPFYQDYA